MDGDPSGDGFDVLIVGWVREALARGVRSLPDLLRSLPGVYPTEVIRAMDRIGDGLPMSWRQPCTCRDRASKDDWPVEHPLDFDWRFTHETTRRLIDRCQVLSGGQIVLLGTPSLVREASARGWIARISLFDRNEALVRAIRKSFPGIDANRADLVWGEPVPATDAAVAVVDPPWYPEYTAAFLWAAARTTGIGGRVLLSVPAEGTRPGIPEERRALLTSTESFGLRLSSIVPGVLAYRTPPFERNSLRAAGVSSIPSDWRRGDLAEFTLESKAYAPRPALPGPLEDWAEVSLGSVRIKLRLRGSGGFLDPTLAAATPGDMLASVSRRDPARAMADVWTSGNRIFRCPGTEILHVVVSALERGDNIELAVERSVGRSLSADELDSVHRSAEQVRELVRREEREIADHGHRRNDRDLVEAIR